MGVQTWANEVDLDNASVQLVAVVASFESTTELFFSVRAVLTLLDPSEFPFSAAASPLSVYVAACRTRKLSVFRKETQ